MTRKRFTPQEYGVDMDRERFGDLIAETFNGQYRGQWTVDEMLLHPREAGQFCEDVRRAHNFHDVPDHVILRVLLARRKNPS